MWRVLPLLSLLSWGGAEGHAMALTWSELGPAIQGKTVAVVLAGRVQVQGRVVSVESDSLIVDVKKSSDTELHPRRRSTIPRSSISSLQRVHRSHVNRIVFTAVGVGAGLFVPFASSSIRGGGSTGATLEYASGASWVALPVGGGLGYLLGRWRDRESTSTIHLAVSDLKSEVASGSGGTMRARRQQGLAGQPSYP